MSGGYPMGAQYDPRAPWNEPDPLQWYATCPICGGDCGDYMDELGNRISKREYDSLTVNKQAYFDFVRCEHCDGDGVVEIEPDYDNYQD